MKVTVKYIAICFLLTSLSCKEELELESQDFESVLVVEATITNELKHQEVKLSQTFLLEEGSEQILENNANVNIIDSLGNSFSFTQNEEGVYISDIEFKALPSTLYKLKIVTIGGNEYESTLTELTPNSSIDAMYPTLINDEYVTIFIDVSGIENNAQYFRYEWEETYKIIAPNHTYYDATIVNVDNTSNDLTYDIEITPREQEERVCYGNKKSTNIIQASTSELDENLISRLALRKLDKNDSKIISRYSIIVKQISQNIGAYSYYKTINELGNTSSLLSENQPGFILSNVHSTSNTNEKVLGFFEVASVTSKRIYFNFSDLNLTMPDYFHPCSIIDLDYNDNIVDDGDFNERLKLYQLVALRNYKYISHVNTFYKITRPECGDCTTIGTNIQPDFWEE